MSGKYAHEEGADAERPVKVCAEAGRKCVRSIHQYAILSVEWLTMVESLKQLNRLVQLEGRMPVNSKVADIQGRNGDSDGTLWDQEAHENAIRILVEEAKVNLCLRMMHDFKRWQSTPTENRASMASASQALEKGDMQLEQKCLQFEEFLGLLLMRAFQHVEALQLMDVPLLIEHCAMVLTNCKHLALSASSVNPSLKMQETLVLYYFSSLMKHSEELNNTELLAKTREHNLINLVINRLLGTAQWLPIDVFVGVAEGFAALTNNEDFRTDWESFFEDRQAIARFLELEEKLANVVLKEFPAKKKDIRPLLDFFNVLKRSKK